MILSNENIETKLIKSFLISLNENPQDFKKIKVIKKKQEVYAEDKKILTILENHKYDKCGIYQIDDKINITEELLKIYKTIIDLNFKTNEKNYKVEDIFIEEGITWGTYNVYAITNSKRGSYANSIEKNFPSFQKEKFDKKSYYPLFKVKEQIEVLYKKDIKIATIDSISIIENKKVEYSINIKLKEKTTVHCTINDDDIKSKPDDDIKENEYIISKLIEKEIPIFNFERIQGFPQRNYIIEEEQSLFKPNKITFTEDRIFLNDRDLSDYIKNIKQKYWIITSKEYIDYFMKKIKDQRQYINDNFKKQRRLKENKNLFNEVKKVNNMRKKIKEMYKILVEEIA